MHKSIRVLTTLSLPLLFAQNVSAATLEQAVKDSLLWHPQVSASVNSRYSADQDLRAAKGDICPPLTSPQEQDGNKQITPLRAQQTIIAAIYTGVNPA
ncbi:hypothetical protein ACFOJF_04190 [Pseudocitrobacter faecalis]